MIKTFGNKETGKKFNQVFSKKLPHSIQKTALRKLMMNDQSKILMICGSRRQTGLKRCQVPGKVNTVSVLTASTGSASDTQMEISIMLRLQIIINRRNI